MTSRLKCRLVEKGLKRKRQRYSMQVVAAIAVSRKESSKTPFKE